MTFNNVTIRDFKSINELTLTFSKINIFIGENDTGKTNILESLAFASLLQRDCNITNIELFNAGIRAYEIHKISNKKDITFNINGNMYVAHLIGKFYPYYKSVIFPKAISELKLDLNSILENQKKQYIDFKIFRPEDTNLKDKNNEVPVPLAHDGEGLWKLLNTIHDKKPDTFKKIENELKNFFDWIERIEIEKGDDYEKSIFIINKYDNIKLNLKNVGTSFLYALTYLTLIISDYTLDTFAIDNFDSYFTGKLARTILNRFIQLGKKYKKQIFITISNPNSLDDIYLYDSELKLFQVQKIKNKTEISHIRHREELWTYM